MSTISAVSSTTTTDTTSTTSTDNSIMGSEEFLKLLTVQLSNQDPFEPMSDTEFISQMANFSSLEQMNTLSSNFSSFSARQEQLSSQAFLGKVATINDGSEEGVSGTVSSVSIDADGSIKVTIDGTQYDSSLITSVSLPTEDTDS